MFKRLIFILLLISTCISGFSQTTDLLISEYVEGSSNNKYIEIYNGTGAAVNLTDYRLRLYANGATTPTNDALLSGTLADNSVIVYENSAAFAYGGAATTSTAANFNGDDAIVIYKISTASIVDIFGNIGCDPGASWSSGTFTTANKTLVRNADICSGVTSDPTNTSCPFPTLSTEWTQLNQDDVSNLGSHTNTCSIPCVPNSEPTTNSSTLNFSNIDCNSMDLDWTTEGNGSNRIVVISTSAIIGTPTDLTNYAANPIYGSGSTIAAGEFVIYNGTGNTTTVTGLTVSTTYHFAIFEYNGTTSNCTENYFTSSFITGNETTTSSIPSSNASAYTFSLIGCNGITLDWSSPPGNGGSLVVLRAGSDITTDPTDGTTYTANNTFGSGTDIGTNEFVVYNGTGTSVNINGLSASTTYFVNVFDYNGTGSCAKYRVSDEISSSETTTACSDCPYMTSMLVNSCDIAPCTEGDNEMFLFNSMDYYVSTSASDITVNYGSTSPASGTYADSFTSTTDHDALDSMNADIGCANKFIDASTVSHIPAQSTFLMLNESICADAFDWSSICSGTTGNVYVLFSADGGWNGTGVFANNPSGTRHFRTVFEGCTIDYTYDNTIDNADGAYVAWTSTGGAATYGTDGCTLSSTILPINLLYFKGKEAASENLLEWSTTTEINNDYFTLERSHDALNFNEIGILSGAGNSSIQLDYKFIDDAPNSGINYYRLTQTDYNGDFSISNIIALNNNQLDAKIYVSHKTLRVKLTEEISSGKIEIIDALGRTVYSDNITASKNINLDNYISGIYLIKIDTPSNTIIRKIKF
ncbi:lamin tail domain-containing protein [Vicingaceae bacterium]|nr:lamin tail domain-containing protein [Vicingaceae bacterium]